MRPIVLIGGGGHCKSVIEAAVSQGIEILGILDLPGHLGENVLDLKIIGTDENIKKYVPTADFVITIGQIKNPVVRMKTDRLISEAGGRLATIIASTAHVSCYAKIGEGSVILHGAVVNADAVIGRNAIINTLANLEHDVKIGDFCHISTGVMVNGNVTIGDNVFIGSQSVVANGISICSDSIIGAGSLIRKDIDIAGGYAGNPLKPILKP